MRLADDLRSSAALWLSRMVFAALVAVLAVAGAHAQSPPQTTSLDDLVSAVVRVKTYINPDAQTMANLGREREGSGIVIDDDGLVLTIGYLMVEAYAAQVITNDGRTVAANIVGYDYETGFGLLRATEPLKLKPLPLGKSAEVKTGDPALVASFGGIRMVAPVRVVSTREFAGYWEYLLDMAIFTAPPHPAWSGAALINRDGRLVGVGSLIVNDAAGTDEPNVGNMFVPIDRLAPILADLLTDGRVSGPGRPWIGITTNEVRGHLLVTNVTPGGPAEKAGLQRGDIIVGVDNQPTKTLVELYRKIWARGDAGVTIPLDIGRADAVRRIDVKSINRLERLRLKTTL